MAATPTWQIRWQVPFKSLGGIGYTVNIYDWNWSGAITTLTGGAQPFVTHEDDSEDAFTPIRTQSGYITIVLNPAANAGDATILEDILPINDRSRLVRLTHVEDNSTVVDWQGFLKCSMYTQPWEGSAHLVQIPIQSMVAALESIEIDPTDTSIARMAGLVTHAFGQLIADDATDHNSVAASFMGDVYIQDDGKTRASHFVNYFLDWKAFIQSQDETDNNVRKTRMYGWNWKSILEAVCNLYGMTLREKGKDLYFMAYDVNGTEVEEEPGVLITLPFAYDYSWTQMVAIAAGQSVSVPNRKIYTDDLLNNMVLKGADSVQGIMQGKKRVSVILSINNDKMLMKPTEATGNGEAIIDVANMNKFISTSFEPHVYVQPHTEIVDGVEKDTFWRVSGTGTSTRQDCIDNSVLTTNNLEGNAINAWVTGCFPVRWAYMDNASADISMRPGIFFNQKGLPSGSVTVQECYMLKTAESYSLKGGYLNIGAAIYNFWLGWLGGDVTVGGDHGWWFGNTKRSDHTMITIIACTLSMGNKEWQAELSGNGASWAYTKGEWADKVNGSPKIFWLIFDGNNLRSNWSEDLAIEESEGYFVPIANKVSVQQSGATITTYEDTLMSGAIELKIWNVRYLYSSLKSDQVTSPSRIMTDLQVEYLFKQDIGEVNKNANTYRRSTDVSFRNEDTVNLNIGTWNANTKGRCFVLRTSDPTSYIQEETYRDGSTDTKERQEIHLLGRLVNYYKKSRQWTQAVVQHTMETLRKRYTYNGHRMVGIDATTDWSRDSKTVKFIEVTGENE